jgi:MoaA/NifB/PqqE/SkfB family radical SAM enzyme
MVTNVESPIDPDLLPTRGPRLNLAIGPNCPVRCEGCYNYFGDSSSTGELITADEIIDFATDVRERNIDGVTLSGGDPLFHPEIVEILLGLHALEYRIKLDTVGTAFYDDAQIVFKGRGVVPRINIESVKDTLESVTLPLDGVDQETVWYFRRGRKNLLEETKMVAGLLAIAGVTFDFNTVVNAKNVKQIDEIGKLAEDTGASTWHVFEYDTSGPNPSSHKENLALDNGQFDAATKEFDHYTTGGMRIDVRAQESRVGMGAYFFVNDAGEAWCPSGSDELSIRYGHIVHNKVRVLAAYDRYLAAFWEKFNPQLD